MNRFNYFLRSPITHMDNSIGSRAQVMHGTKGKTSGGLRASNLKYNKHGKIVSKKRSAKARKEKRLQKAGWHTKKGEFGSFKKEGSKKRSRKRRTR
jgi:hypothetical protein